ncbi:C-type lectin domain-containing protein [Chryseobacterium sp.]|uniref:C-type lectin domain-containing protein n=1 Tax=Chryseobacterium sp. TaxID=1871047 RepID=UPI0031E37C88
MNQKMYKKNYTALILFFGIFSYSQQFANLNNISTFSYNGKEYEIIRELKTWENAAACAKQRGGYLVEINSADEQNAVYNAILSSGISSNYISVSDGGGIAYLWVG